MCLRFSRAALKHYGVGLPKAGIEDIEDIEILRLLEADIPIQMASMSVTIAVDTAEDLQRVRDIIHTQGDGLSSYDCG